MGGRLTTVFNMNHFDISYGDYTFKARELTQCYIDQRSHEFYQMRCNKKLKIDKSIWDEWINQTKQKSYQYNMVYDVTRRNTGNAYPKVIEALANPVIKHLPEGSFGFTEIPDLGVNLRFFNSQRIFEQAKCPVGPRDIFMSHGVADKEYWRGDKIKEFDFAVVPGPAWRDKIIRTGFKGKIFITGHTKLEPFFNGEVEQVKHDKPYVVWAPTHGYHNRHRGRSSYPQCVKLINEIPDTYETKLALHPTGKRKSGDLKPTTNDLYEADVVIADGGSTIYEAWFLGKPVIFPDWLCKKDILAHFDEGNLEHNIYDLGIGYHARNMDELIEMIELALRHGIKQQSVEFAEYIFPSELRGKAGKLTAEVLEQIYTATK